MNLEKDHLDNVRNELNSMILTRTKMAKEMDGAIVTGKQR